MTTQPLFLIIVNEHAASGHAKLVWPQIETALKQKHLHYTVYFSEYSGHTILLAKNFALENTDPNAVVLVVGGDGTLNQAINGLQQSGRNLPVAYIPAGSGNDFARGVGLSRDPLKALEQVLATRTPIKIDIGHYHDQRHHKSAYFVNNIGIGFDANVVATTNHAASKRWLNNLHLGSLSYVSSLVKVFAHQDSFPVQVSADTKTQKFAKAFLVTTTNHPYFGGGVPIMPLASVHDGQLDLVIVEKLSVPYFLFLFGLMFSGKHLKHKAVHHLRGQQIQVQTDSLEFGQMDGEEMGRRSFDINFTVVQQEFWLTLPPEQSIRKFPISQADPIQ